MSEVKLEHRQFNTFEEAEEYICNIPRFTAKHSIKDTRAFLEKIGSPDESMKIIHVAGTNGKGSTCAYLTSILKMAGYSVALFTSPHLADICERFNVDGADMTHDEFLNCFKKVYDSLDWENSDSPVIRENSNSPVIRENSDSPVTRENSDSPVTRENSDSPAASENSENSVAEDFYHPTYFEFLFFMAMIWFKEKKAEWCVLETGLGGLLDATNSVHHKEAAVITRIGMDHMEYLGNTIPDIARQKAGIIQPGIPVIYGDFVAEASEAIVDEADKNAAILKDKGISCSLNRFYPVGPEKIVRFENNAETVAFSLSDGYYKDVLLSLDTVAAYQPENAALAVRTVEALKLCDNITPRMLSEALHDCHWAGRMEEIFPEVFIDGAHNPDGIRAFLETVKKDGFKQSRRSLLFGVVSDKNYTEMIEKIVKSGLFNDITITSLHSSRSTKTVTLKEIFDKYPEVTCYIAENPVSGLKELMERRITDSTLHGCRIYAAGSLYLVGEIKKAVADRTICE